MPWYRRIKMVGSAIKLAYAFVFQEKYFPNPLNKYSWFNKLGAKLLPVVNKIANEITGFKHTD